MPAGSIDDLRDINRRLGLNFPVDGPEAVNKLLLELLQDIPEANVSLKIADCIVEIVQVQNQSIRMIKPHPARPSRP